MSGNFWETRTGWSKLKQRLLLEPLPGGSRWAAAFGSLLLFSFLVQVITGVLLAMNYSPSTDSAWLSVNFIMTEVSFGKLIRSLHHWGSSAMVILLLCHLVQVFVWGAYKKPREFTWMTGVMLLMLVLGLAFTGYLLPWDQKAYWATKVGLGIVSTIPGIGETIKTALQGGPTMGNLTLTRFFSIHAFVLPGFVMLLVSVHLYFFRAHGVTPPWWESSRQLDAEREPFWPGQAFKDAVCALLLLIVLFLWAHTHPAPLESKADPSQPYEARPEWYFMFLFYLLQFFKGPYEIVGTFVLPLLFFCILFFWPFLDRNPLRDPRRRPVAVGMLGLTASGLIGLTIFAIATDVRMKEPAAVLANSPVKPPAGASQKLDVAGLFEKTCAACHGVDGKGSAVRAAIPSIPDFTNLSWQLGHTDVHLMQGILEGRPPKMPAYRGKLSTEEATALAIYVRAFVSPAHPDVAPPGSATTNTVASAPNVAAPPSTATSPAVSSPSATRPQPVKVSKSAPVPAAELFQTFCVDCHSADGRGGLVRDVMPSIPDFTDKQWQQKATDDAMMQAILNGKGDYMVSFKDKLNTDDAEALTRYVRAFAGGSPSPPIASAPVSPPKEPSPSPTNSKTKSEPPPPAHHATEAPPTQAARERLTLAANQYRQYCLACHGTNGSGAALRRPIPAIPDFRDAAWQASHSDEQLQSGILNGYGRFMPPFHDHLSRPQAQALTAYIRAFATSKKTASPKAPLNFEQRMRQLQARWQALEREIKKLSRAPRSPARK